MIFNSYEFLFFFPVVSILYFLFPHAWRWALLLAASCLFYMAFIPKYILILVFTIIVDYFAGIWIAGAKGLRRRWFLCLSLAANIGILAYFKYYNFLVENLNALSQAAGWNPNFVLTNIILPIGLSFHTFQAISYTIEVYRGNQRAERHFGIYALYVMFYPQLVAGPIERPQNLLHQFREVHRFEYERVTFGLMLMAWGLFKKVVIADRVAVFVDAVYKDPSSQTGFFLTLATLAFGIQIFCDFSGYSDMALGAAQVMGFRLMQNFRQPYHARSISEFWRRWHISLSTWFRDYVYFPLGGNRVGPARHCLNLLLVFLLSGLWHGAQWTFVIWGGLHAFYIGFGMFTAQIRTRFREWIGLKRLPWLEATVAITITYLLVNFAWIFFRSPNLTEALEIVSKLPTGWNMLAKPHEFFLTLINLNFPPPDFVYTLVGLLVLAAVHQFQRHGSIRELIARQSTPIRWVVYYTGLTAIVLLGVFDQRGFIYFQF